MADKITNPKLLQFVEELNALKDKYQYDLTPSLEITVNGIAPTLRINDRIPPLDQPVIIPAPTITPIPTTPEPGLTMPQRTLPASAKEKI